MPGDLKGSRWDPLTKETPQEGLGAQGRTIDACSTHDKLQVTDTVPAWAYVS
jgi:hypothetical protein